jgi:hypothetical protein
MDSIQEAMSQAIEAMACKSPERLRKIALPHWYGRYGGSTSRLGLSGGKSQRDVSAQEIRSDIRHLLAEIHQLDWPEANQLREVKALEFLWKQQFEHSARISNRKDNIVENLLDCESCTVMAGGRAMTKANEKPQSSHRKHSTQH